MFRSPLARGSVVPILLVLLVACPAVARAVAVWTPTEWRGERAWRSSSRGWTAVVSEERARLVSLSPEGREENLLYAEQKDLFSWGGHRFWLGPQSVWTAPWPPPTDWERSAAVEITAEGGLLRVRHARTDENYPQLERGYAWKEGVLHCTASWRDARFQGIHIIQMPRGATVRVRGVPTTAAPQGYVLLPIFRRAGIRVNEPVSPDVVTMTGDELVMRYAGNREKIGVAPQPIVAELGALRLILRRGVMSGMSETEPDLGMLTQVFFGSAEDPFVEIEQLTPLGGNEVAHSEILLEPSHICESENPTLE